MLLNMICAMLWMFCAGLNLGAAINGDSFKWILVALNLLCAVLFADMAYRKYKEIHDVVNDIEDDDLN